MWIAATLVFAAASAGLLVWSRGWLVRRRKRRVTVHLTIDRTLEGLLVTVAPDGLVLRAARLIEDGSVDLGGDVWVPRSNIVFVQVHGAR